MLVQPSIEVAQFPTKTPSELADLDYVDRADIVVVAAQLGILLDREAVVSDRLFDQVRDPIMKAVLTVGANTNVQLEEVSQGSCGCDESVDVLE